MTVFFSCSQTMTIGVRMRKSQFCECNTSRACVICTFDEFYWCLDARNYMVGMCVSVCVCVAQVYGTYDNLFANKLHAYYSFLSDAVCRSFSLSLFSVGSNEHMHKIWISTTTITSSPNNEKTQTQTRRKKNHEMYWVERPNCCYYHAHHC